MSPFHGEHVGSNPAESEFLKEKSMKSKKEIEELAEAVDYLVGFGDTLDVFMPETKSKPGKMSHFCYAVQGVLQYVLDDCDDTITKTLKSLQKLSKELQKRT